MPQPIMRRPYSQILGSNRRRACVVIAAAALALGGAGSASAGGVHAAVARPAVSFPSPGAMAFSRLPAAVRSGHHFTLRAVMPLAIFGGVIHFQRQTPAGGWRTLISADVSPKVFWLHWMVPARWRGTQFEVRFVLESGGQMLAVSSPYTIAVSA
jgi:hypothetical protein